MHRINPLFSLRYSRNLRSILQYTTDIQNQKRFHICIIDILYVTVTHDSEIIIIFHSIIFKRRQNPSGTFASENHGNYRFSFLFQVRMH